MGYIQKHNYKGVFKMQETPMTDAEVRAKYDRTAPKPKPVDDSSENATPAVMPTPVKKSTNFSKILNTVAKGTGLKSKILKAAAVPPALKAFSLGVGLVGKAIESYKNKK